MTSRLFYSNDIHALADILAENIAETNIDLTSPPVIIAPNPHVMKWLKLIIAKKSGLCINLDFTVLDKGLFSIMRRLDMSQPGTREMDHIDLSLLLCNALLHCDKKTEALFYHYLHFQDRPYGSRLWQLASRLARYFSEYQLYRNEMISAWKTNNTLFHTEMEHAQQKLYNAIFKTNGIRDTFLSNAYTLAEYWEHITQNKVQPLKDLKLFIFGISQLSPLHTKIIYELGKHIPMNIYQFNPCSEFWEDITSPREDKWLKIKNMYPVEKPDGEHLAENRHENLLLKLWGKPGRETLKLLSTLDEQASKDASLISDWITSSQEPKTRTVLHEIQDHILCRTSVGEHKYDQDTSLQVVACPDIFREVESVYNSIINNLARDPKLKMTDIAIMVPDIELYSPVIKSVFFRKPQKISFSIIDSSALTESIAGKALLSILDIANGDFNRKDIFNLLYNPCIMETFMLTRTEVDAWLTLVQRLHIFNDPNQSQPVDNANSNTWRQGILRLCLGRIMSQKKFADAKRLYTYQDIIPYEDLHSRDMELLQSFSYTIETLFVTLKEIAPTNSGKGWHAAILSLISQFISIPRDKPEETGVIQNIKTALKKLEPFESLPLDFIREYIKDNLGAISGSTGSYLVSGINISALVPKRQIPFKIMYILGMGEGDFPGAVDSSSLDLRNIRRKIGDISRPDANRYLFLETLLLAQDKLYITFINKDLQKDQDFYPNSIIGQLIAYINNYVIVDKFNILTLPISGDSIQHLNNDASIASWSDFTCQKCDDTVYLNMYSQSDQYILAKRIAKAYPHLTKELQLTQPRQWPDFSAVEIIETDKKKFEVIDLNELVTFLYNPANATIKRHLRIRENDFFSESGDDEEPLYSLYPFSSDFINSILDYYLQKPSEKNLYQALDDYYYNLRLRGETPSGVFADIDREQLKNAIKTRISNNNTWQNIIDKDNKEWAFYHNLTIGEYNCEQIPDKIFTDYDFSLHDLEISINGHIPYFWKNKKTGASETLTFSRASSFRNNSLLPAFLFFVIARAGFNKQLEDFTGEQLTIHVIYKSGIKSYEFKLEKNECRDYISRLISDFLDSTSYELMPFEIIAKDHMQPEKLFKTDDTISGRTIIYREKLIEEIESETAKQQPVFRISPLLELVNPEVPQDAYLKAERRLSLFFKAQPL